MAGSAQNEEVPGPRYGMSVLLAMILVSITLNLVTLPFAQVANEISQTYNITDIRFSLLIGVFFAVPVTLMSVSGGWLSDRVSRRRLLVAAMAIWTAGAVWSALAPDYAQMAASRMVVAAAIGVKFPLAMTWVADAFPAERRAKAIGALFVVLNIGPAISSVVAGVVLQAAEAGKFAWLPLVGGLAPWRAGLLILALASLLPLPCVALLNDVRRGAAEKPVAGSSMTSRSYPPWMAAALALSAALLALADTATLGWLPALLKRQYHFNSEQVGFTFALIVTTAGIAGPLLAGVLDDRVHRRFGLQGSLITCMVACAVCAPLLATFAQPRPGVLIGSLLVSGIVSVMALTVAYVAMQSLLSAERRGTGTGLAHALENLARAGAPTVVATASLPLAGGSSGNLGTGVAIVCVSTYVVAGLLYLAIALYLKSHPPCHTDDLAIA